jgi:hypothetical protein
MLDSADEPGHAPGFLFLNVLVAFSTRRGRGADPAAVANVRIWTPPHFASTPFCGDKVRLLTYIRPRCDLS